MHYKYTKNHFSFTKRIKWEEIISKINYEYEKKSLRVLASTPEVSPTFLLLTDFYPNTIQKIYNKVKAKLNISVMHTYVSFGPQSTTFGRHKDSDDVIIVQSIGSVSYKFDDGEVFKLNPGDSLYIQKGVYHEPIVHEPRVTLSFSW